VKSANSGRDFQANLGSTFTLDNIVVFLVWIAISALMVVASQPWLTTVGAWITQVSDKTPLVGPIVGFLSGIWFIGKPLAGLVLFLFEFLGTIGAFAIYVLVNLCEIGVFGNSKHRLGCFVFDGFISSLSVVFYGEGIQSLVNDFPDLDPDLWQWNGLGLFVLCLFGVEIVHAFIKDGCKINLGTKY
jgi:hypothetical protein